MEFADFDDDEHNLNFLLDQTYLILTDKHDGKYFEVRSPNHYQIMI